MALGMRWTSGKKDNLESLTHLGIRMRRGTPTRSSMKRIYHLLGSSQFRRKRRQNLFGRVGHRLRHPISQLLTGSVSRSMGSRRPRAKAPRTSYQVRSLVLPLALHVFNVVHPPDGSSKPISNLPTSPTSNASAKTSPQTRPPSSFHLLLQIPPRALRSLNISISPNRTASQYLHHPR